MYSKIINPDTGRKVSINGKIGKLVLKKYIDRLRGGQKKDAYMVYGRFQPPHISHSELIDLLIDTAENNAGTAFLFTSKKDNNFSDPKKAQSYINSRSDTSKKKKMENPIKIRDKLDILNEIHGHKNIIIVDVIKENISSPFHAVNWLLNNGYKNIKFMVGTDRFLGFKKTFRKTGYENVEIIESERPIDGVSGKEVRNIALNTILEHLDRFDNIKHLSESITNDELKNIENIIKIYSKIKGVDNCYKNLKKILNSIKNIKSTKYCQKDIHFIKNIVHLIQEGSSVSTLGFTQN